MQAHPLIRRRGIPWQLQALAVAGAFIALLGLRSVNEPGLPERELPPTAAEWADPNRDPIDLDLGAAGSVAIPAGWTLGHIILDGPVGSGSYTLFQHPASGTVLHWGGPNRALLPFDFGRIADSEVRAQAEEIARDLVDGD